MQNIIRLNQQVTEFYDKMSSWEDSVVKNTGYSLAQIHTIEVLGNFGALRMNELAEKLGITTGTLTVQIEKLVSAELIQRCRNEQDRRVIVVMLTTLGQAVYQKHNQHHLELMKSLTKDFSEEVISDLNDYFKMMNQQF